MSFGTTTSARELGSYELLSKIAEGGMGAVYKARHKLTRRVVAIKVIPAETARQPVLLRRFEQEFRAASLIDHPNVVKAIEYCGLMPTPFLVMEYVDGKALGDVVEEGGPLGEEAAVGVIAQVCEGLHRAHKQGLIHRDVKPDNILLTADGVAKLTDLGLVKDVEGEENLTRTGKGLGTPHFMSPEQFRKAKNADVRCDVYSLGATLYMLITGQIPFAGNSPLDCWIRKSRNEFPAPRTLAPHLSERVDFAIRRAMTANPADRPASCREFMEDLIGAAWRPGQGGGLSDTTVTMPADGNTLWYMVVYDELDQPKTVKGSTDTIRKNILAGTLGDLTQVLVCRTKAGPFVPLRAAPEFRDLILEESLSADGSKSGLRSPVVDPPSKTRFPRQPVPLTAVNALTPMPARPSEEHGTQGDHTDECSFVPLTDQTNMELDSAERPKLSTRRGRTPPTQTGRPMLTALLVGAAVGVAAAVAYVLTR